MVNYDTVLIRYGELSTKGKNRKDFIRRLNENLKNMLSFDPQLKFEKTYDRIYIRLGSDSDPQKIRQKISQVFGISSFSFTEKVDPNLDAIKARCLEIAQETTDKHTFKIITRRHDKSFPMHSDGVNRAVAGEILKYTDHKVDVHHPDFTIQIEIREDAAYLTSEKIPGAGGYPAGINGRALLLLSGGIDSPVAAYALMKRGIRVEAIHFAAPPYTSDNARQKVLDLASMVSVYQGSMRVHIIHFTDLQLAIYKAAGDPYAVTLMRRMMFRIAEKIARKNKCLALGTGESVGQVASQTLQSMACINSTVTMPVLRPLVCMDKVEIIDQARKIGTYETSILPYEDCCTIFDPKNPVTHPTEEKAAFYESRFDWEKMVNDCVDQEEIVYVKPQETEDYL